jgi:UDP-glucose 6-dehydrogenase
MKSIVFFKTNNGKKGSSKNRLVGWLAVGDHAILADGTNLLSAECVTLREIEEAADNLKKLIDKAVIVAKKKLP